MRWYMMTCSKRKEPRLVNNSCWYSLSSHSSISNRERGMLSVTMTKRKGSLHQVPPERKTILMLHSVWEKVSSLSSFARVMLPCFSSNNKYIPIWRVKVSVKVGKRQNSREEFLCSFYVREASGLAKHGSAFGDVGLEDWLAVLVLDKAKGVVGCM